MGFPYQEQWNGNIFLKKIYKNTKYFFTSHKYGINILEIYIQYKNIFLVQEYFIIFLLIFFTYFFLNYFLFFINFDFWFFL